MLNDGDKAECKEIAREIVKEVLIEHTISCPHGIKMDKACWLFIGCGLTGGLGISELIRLFV